MQANGETNDATTSQLKDAFSQLQDKSQDGSAGATVSGGEMLVQPGGPIQFAGISAYQNGFVERPDLAASARLDCVRLPSRQKVLPIAANHLEVDLAPT
jgi:hypothetical protein